MHLFVSKNIALEEEKLLQAEEFASKSDDQDGDEKEEEVEVDVEDEKDTTLHNEDGKKTVIRRYSVPERDHFTVV